jgi:hypothetical protein
VLIVDLLLFVPFPHSFPLLARGHASNLSQDPSLYFRFAKLRKAEFQWSNPNFFAQSCIFLSVTSRGEK